MLNNQCPQKHQYPGPQSQQQQQQQLIQCGYDSKGYGMQNGLMQIPFMMAPMMAPMSPMSPMAPFVVMQDMSAEIPQTKSPTKSSWSTSSRASSSSIPEDQRIRPSEWKRKDVELAVSKLKGDDTNERDSMLEEVINKAWAMSQLRHACLLVQAAFDTASASKQLALATAFKGHVWEALVSPHANHVLQRCIAVLPPGQVTFILEELQGRIVEAAQHRFGCRVLQRLLEHCTADQTTFLVEEVLSDLGELCRHLYGNYVVQHILEHGSPEERMRVAQLIRPEVRFLARHKVGSYVVQSLFLHCPRDEKENLVGNVGKMENLQRSQYGSFVSKRMKIKEMSGKSGIKHA